jgi:hypothetical protein
MSNTPERMSAEQWATKCAAKYNPSYYSVPFTPHAWVIDAMEVYAALQVEADRQTRLSTLNAYLERAEKAEAELKEVTRQRDAAIELLKELKTYIWDSTVDNSISHFLSQLENEKKDGE